MARTKQVPSKRQASSEYFNKETAEWETSDGKPKTNGSVVVKSAPAKADAGIMQLVIAVSGIYASFLTWAYLQEKLTTTRHGPAQEVWHFPVFLNTIQSLFAAAVGSLYLILSTPRGAAVPPIIPSSRILAPLALVAVTSSLASPFGYASLAHIDYITFLLAKSCKLLPVMLLHITVFRKRYPLYKYLVVAAVTAGVAVFTLHSGSKKKKQASRLGDDARVGWGMLLLGINLLFDGLTNSTQDYIFSAFQPYSGPQMMCANNVMSSLVTGAYLLVGPAVLGATGAGEWLGLGKGDAGELGDAMAFMARYPAVWKDVLGFAACGAVGQVFICKFSFTLFLLFLASLDVGWKGEGGLYVVDVFFGVASDGDGDEEDGDDDVWLGVGLVFGGIGVEAGIARREKMAKEKAKKEKSG